MQYEPLPIIADPVIQERWAKARIMGDVSIQYNIDLRPPQQPAQPATDNKEQKKLPAHVNLVFNDAYKFQQGELTFELYQRRGAHHEKAAGPGVIICLQ